MTVYDCSDPEARSRGISEAVGTLGRGGLIVLPTDTVYGIGANAFDPAAVAALRRAKARGRDQPPPVLVSQPQVISALAESVPATAQRLMAQFWPGALTIICRAQPTLAWDLGDTAGTVAVRMPEDEVALELLERTGPLAVSSANRSGQPPATTALAAAAALGDEVGVYLDDGPSGGGQPSTIVDATGEQLRIVRHGALSRLQLAEVVAELGQESEAPDTGNGPQPGPSDDSRAADDTTSGPGTGGSPA